MSFFGPRSEYVVSGSDCGHVYIWSKEDGKLQAFLFADETGLDELNLCTTATIVIILFSLPSNCLFAPFNCLFIY